MVVVVECEVDARARKRKGQAEGRVEVGIHHQEASCPVQVGRGGNTAS